MLLSMITMDEEIGGGGAENNNYQELEEIVEKYRW